MSALSKRGTVEIAGIAERQTVQFPGKSSIVIRKIMKLSKDGKCVRKVGRKVECKVQCNGWVGSRGKESEEDEASAPGA